MNWANKRISVVAMGSVVLSIGCGAQSEGGDDRDVDKVEGAVRNGTLVTPFGPNSAPPETKSIVSLGGCGGTVITSSWVLTAKHCGFAVGAVVESVRPSGNVDRTVDQVVNHPPPPGLADNADDFTLLHLSSPFTDITGATLFLGNTGDIVGQTLAVYGYGPTSATITTPPCTGDSQCPAGWSCDTGVCFNSTPGLHTANLATQPNTGDPAGITYDLLATTSQQTVLPGDSGSPNFLNSQLVGLNSWWNFDLTGGGGSSLPANRSWMNGVISGTGQPLAWHNSVSGATQFWQMNGIARSSFANVVSSWNTPASTGWLPVAQADFNKDGNTDILWHNGSSGQSSVWFMAGATPTGSALLNSSSVKDSSGWRIAGSADFDRDGSADILWHNLTTGALSVWYMNGVTPRQFGNLDSTLNVPDSTGWHIVGMGDFNGDGSADIFWRQGSSGALSVWYMNGIVRMSAANLDASLDVPDSSGWQIVAVTDMNNDAVPDLLWRNAASGALSAWFMNQVGSVLTRSSSSDLDPSLDIPASTGWGLMPN